MVELLLYMVKAIVNHPEAVRVETIEGERSVILRLDVAKEDRGIIIGRHGRMADAIRVLLGAAAYKEKRRVLLEISED